MHFDLIVVEVSAADLLNARADEIKRNTPQLLLDMKDYYSDKYPTIRYTTYGYYLEVLGHKFTIYNNGGYNVAKAGSMSREFCTGEVLNALYAFQDVVGVKVA